MLNNEQYTETVEKLAGEVLEDSEEIVAAEEAMQMYCEAAEAFEQLTGLMKEAEEYYEAAEEVIKEAEENYGDAEALYKEASEHTAACDEVFGELSENGVDEDYLSSTAADADIVDLVEKTAAVYKSAEEDMASAEAIAAEAEEQYANANEYRQAAIEQYAEAEEALGEIEQLASELEEAYPGIYEAYEEHTAGIKDIVGNVKSGVGNAAEKVKNFSSTQSQAAHSSFHDAKKKWNAIPVRDRGNEKVTARANKRRESANRTPIGGQSEYGQFAAARNDWLKNKNRFEKTTGAKSNLGARINAGKDFASGVGHTLAAHPIATGAGILGAAGLTAGGIALNRHLKKKKAQNAEKSAAELIEEVYAEKFS